MSQFGGSLLFKNDNMNGPLTVLRKKETLYSESSIY